MRYEFPFQMLRYTEDADDGLWTDKTHYLMLYAMTKMVRPAVAVEIGSRRGGSAMWIGRALEEEQHGHLYCIDPFIAAHGGAPGFEIHFRHNLQELGIQRITLIKEFSRSALAQIPSDSFDLLFIDGDHSYEGALFDIRTYVPRIRVGGALIIHDCLSEKGVARAIEESSNDVLSPFLHFVTENRQGIWIGIKCG